MRQDSSITEIKGIGEKTKKLFEKMGVYTVGDILLHFPRNYIQYPHPVPIDEMTAEHMQTEDKLAIVARIERTPVTRSGRHMQVTLLVIGSPGHQIQLIWYRMPYIRNTLTHGKYFVFYGNVHIKDGKFVMEQPVVYTPEAYQEIENCFLPVYTLTSGITNNLMIKTMRQALDEEELLTDFLPGEIRTRRELCEYNYAVKQIHFPDTMERLIEARKRLVFDEFFLFIMGMQYQKEKRTRQENRFVMEHPEFVEDLIQKLPYELTGAQRRALHDVTENMQGPYAMQRLIQGDVGSGKTILAFLAMAWCAQNGYQSAIMAPTEVLAQQHYETFQKLCEQFGLHFPVILLTGSMTAKQKRSAYERLELYENALIVGTHALIQEKVQYNNLGLVITDEQHRFGVKQREALTTMGNPPNVLVMSATPIPRTLAIIIYGDLDISVIDELPAQRLPIKNCVVDTSYRPKAYSFMEKQIRQGRQVYVICPMVEESEGMDGENVLDYTLKLRNVFSPDIKIASLHGKMKAKEKNVIMEAFAAGEIQILVSTTVVEVGVNVPNATVMMVENAERFGLAQLHQLRGRVGRGEYQSYCIFMQGNGAKEISKRLQILNKSNDGFYIAGEDLKLRGPGDLFGIRQSGLLEFKLGDIYQDADILKAASETASEILSLDADLSLPQNEELQRRLSAYMKEDLQNLGL
mgnify:CR=1 FL=1